MSPEKRSQRRHSAEVALRIIPTFTKGLLFDKKTILNGLMILLILCSANNITFGVTDSPKFRAEFIQLEVTQGSNLDFFINKKDLHQDLSKHRTF